MVVSVSLVKVTVPGPAGASSVLATRRSSGTGLAVQLGHLGLEVVERDRELDPVDRLGGTGSPFVLGAQEGERRGVDGVDRPGGEARSGVGGSRVEVVGHRWSPQCGSVSSRRRSLARQRPRVGPMLPTGMPRAAATAA